MTDERIHLTEREEELLARWARNELHHRQAREEDARRWTRAVIAQRDLALRVIYNLVSCEHCSEDVPFVITDDGPRHEIDGGEDLRECANLVVESAVEMGLILAEDRRTQR